MLYNIYLLLNKFKKKFYSIFFKSLISFIIRSKSKIFDIIDFGKMIFFKKKKNRLFFIKIYCEKKSIFKINKLIKMKMDIINYFIILKEEINIYICKIFLLKKFLSKNFLILPSMKTNVNFKIQKKIKKIIKILKMFSIIPYNINNYIKKINNFL